MDQKYRRHWQAQELPLSELVTQSHDLALGPRLEARSEPGRAGPGPPCAGGSWCTARVTCAPWVRRARAAAAGSETRKKQASFSPKKKKLHQNLRDLLKALGKGSHIQTRPGSSSWKQASKRNKGRAQAAPQVGQQHPSSTALREVRAREQVPLSWRTSRRWWWATARWARPAC